MSQLLKSEDWTFFAKSTHNYTHGLHLYPARMHPEIARRLIKKYANEQKKVVFDPFMGSGGVLVESLLHNNNSIGFDINPFAVLLSKVKTTPINPKKLNQKFHDIQSKSNTDLKRKINYDNAPSSINLPFWYTKESVKRLQILKKHIFDITDDKVQNFFKICFSLTSRRTSFQKNSIYKIYRMKPEKRKVFRPDPFETFSQVCVANIAKMADFYAQLRSKKSRVFPIEDDTRNAKDLFSHIPQKILDDGKAHLVVTSPPYGDHGTTVAYGQFSRHLGLWLELPEETLLPVDSIGLGGKKKKEHSDLESPLLTKTLARVEKKDSEQEKKTNNPTRAKDVYSYFYDLDKCLEQISQVLKPNKSHCCFVVANRTVRRIKIPTDQIIIELAAKYGFRYKHTIPRTIVKKAMASKNAPENIRYNAGETMKRESVIVWKF